MANSVQKAIDAVRRRGYRVHNGNLELPTADQDAEICGIIRRESGLHELYQCLQALVFAKKMDGPPCRATKALLATCDKALEKYGDE